MRVLLVMAAFLVMAFSSTYCFAQSREEIAGKMVQADKEVRAYQEAKANGTYVDYSVTPTWVTVIYTVVGIGIAGILIALAIAALSDMSWRTRKIILGSGGFVIAALVGLVLIDWRKGKADSEAYGKTVASWGVDPKTSAAASASGESLRPIIYGTDKNLLAGAKNLAQMASDNKVELDTLNLKSKHISVRCRKSNPCGLMPDKHPILSYLDRTQLLYCDDSNKQRGTKGQMNNNVNADPSNFVLTGIAMHFSDSGEMRSFVQGLVNSRVMLSSSELRFVESHLQTDSSDFTSGKGLSIFWRSKSGGLDLCGNKDYNV